MANNTARQIADAIISISHEHSSEITNLKLQKLLYYAQAWYIVFNDRPLFGENIEAWVHGPVVAGVFGDFKHFRWSPINMPGSPTNSMEINEHLNEVWRAYGKYGATELERMAHAESPWREARGGLPPDEPSRNIISHASIKEYYSSLLNG